VGYPETCSWSHLCRLITVLQRIQNVCHQHAHMPVLHCACHWCCTVLCQVFSGRCCKCCADVKIRWHQHHRKLIGWNNCISYNFKMKLSSVTTIILASMMNMYSWTFKFCEVVQKQIWGREADFFCSSSQSAKEKDLLKSVHTSQHYHKNTVVKKLCGCFLTHGV